MSLKSRRRRRVADGPVPPSWPDLLDGVPLCQRLPSADRTELHRHMLVFLDEKHYEGCAGLDLTDAMRIVVAGQASVLLLHRDTDYFPLLRTVLIYPSAYVADVAEETETGLVFESTETRLGEASGHGVVLLTWREVQDDLAADDGSNLVLHEFAHLLDEEHGISDFIAGQGRSPAQPWARAFAEAYDRLNRSVTRGESTVLDPYGLEDHAEFFAVATEAFFQAPRLLAKDDPDLYDALRTYYRQDPAAWPSPGA